MITIERLRPEDAEMLAGIGRVTLVESHGHSAPEEVFTAYLDRAMTIETCMQELVDDANIFHAIYNDGIPAGYSKIILNYSHPAVPLQPVTKLERLYLLKEFYDLRLGQQLFRHIEELSREAGEKGMWLNVWKRNERAMRFYQKQGFITVGESEFVLTDTHSNPNWVMLLTY